MAYLLSLDKSWTGKGTIIGKELRPVFRLFPSALFRPSRSYQARCRELLLFVLTYNLMLEY
jgi:hypothetical protein